MILALKLTVAQAEALLRVANEGLADMSAREDDSETNEYNLAAEAVEKLTRALELRGYRP